MSFLNLMRNRLKPKAVNDALTNVVQKSPPDFSSAEAGKILAVDSDGELEWKDEYSYTPPVYSSTEEINTGEKWVDGKDIYRKVFELVMPIETTQSASVSFDTLISISGTVSSSGGYVHFINSILDFYGNLDKTAITISATNIPAGYRGQTATITVYYTKPDPVPETKNKKGTKK